MGLVVLLSVKMVIGQFDDEEEVAEFFEFENKSDKHGASTTESSDLTISLNKFNLIESLDLKGESEKTERSYVEGGDHRSYGDDHNKGGIISYGNDDKKKIQPKHPGPYGPAKPNYKCKESTETLFVTKVDFTLDEKCFTVYKVECSQGYGEGKVRNE